MATRRTKASDAHEAKTEEPAPSAPEDFFGRIVVFVLDRQRYALPIESVQEIQQIVAISPLPESSPGVVGVVNLRGHVVPVVDMRLLVGFPRAEYGLETPMIFAHTSGGLVALVVDEVEDVFEVPPGSAQAPSRMYALSDLLSCVVRREDGIVFVFDIERLVAEAAVVTPGSRS